MLIEQLLSPVVPTLLPSDTGSNALQLMESSNLEHLPLVEDNKYLALIREDDLLNWDRPEGSLAGSGLADFRPAFFAGGHPFEALRIAHQQNLSVLPVISEGFQYIGSITKDTLLRYLSENSGLEMPGGILILEIKPHDYSLSEVARICENEDVLITSAQLGAATPEGMMPLTIKTNRTHLEAVTSSFERHGYTVKEVYGAQAGQEDVMGRYQLLMNYINM